MVRVNKEVPLTQQRLREVLSYAEETGVFIWISRTSKHGENRVGQVAGCLNNSNGYFQIKIDGYRYLTHRLVWLYAYGYFPEGEKNQIDHVDGNRANNRIENLRVSSQAENCKNTRMKSNNTSGFTGVRREGMSNNSKTAPKTNWYWRAYWHDEGGKQSKVSFSIDKLGEEQAKYLAVAYREKQILLLKVEHGVTYSQRHGC